MPEPTSGEEHAWGRRDTRRSSRRRSEADARDVFSQLYDIVRDVRKEDASRMDRGLELRDAVGRLSATAILLAVSEASSLFEDGFRRVPRKPGAMEYIHLFENEHVSMGIFLLPAGSRIPLHNHPGMTVVSKVLSGALQVTSYDWVGEMMTARDGSCWGEGVQVFDGVVGSVERGDGMGTTRVLFPDSGGNLHRFQAVSDCAILDVICPPYNAREGRTCSYYRVTGGDERRDVRDGDGCDASDGCDGSDANDASDASDGSVAREGGGRVKIVEDLEEDVDIATICDLSATVCR